MRTLKVMRGEARELDKRRATRRVDFSWFSETDNDLMVEMFREIASIVCAQPLGTQKLADGMRASNEGPLTDFAYTNNVGDDLFFYGCWYGGSPGDAYRQVFTLLCSDGSVIEADVIDSCSQSTLSFGLYGDDAARLDTLASAATQAMRTYYQSSAERFQRKSEKIIETLPEVGSLRFEAPPEMTQERLIEKATKHLMGWVGCNGAFRVERDNGDIALLGELLSRGLYAYRGGRIVAFNDASAVCLHKQKSLHVTLYARVPHLTTHLQKFVPLALRDEGWMLISA